MRLSAEVGDDEGNDARSFTIEGTFTMEGATERAAEPTGTEEPAEPAPADEETAVAAQPDQAGHSSPPAESSGPATPGESAGPAETRQTGPADPGEPQVTGPGQASAFEEAGAQPGSAAPSASTAEEDTRSEEVQEGDEVQNDGATEVEEGGPEATGAEAESSAPALTAPSADAEPPVSGSGSDLDQPDHSGGGDGSQARDDSGPASGSPATSNDSRKRPSSAPVPPVSDTSQLSADNAGALSGTRQGGAVVLMIPRARASVGDWVSVFVLPDGTRPLDISDSTSSDWLQIDSSHSVTVDISGLGCGTYRLVVADSDNNLLGWARLEIQEASFSGDSTGATTHVVPGEAAVSETFRIGPEDWMLLGAGMLLVLGAAGFLVVARPGVLRSVARVASGLGRSR
ncbi:hypothetical protein [Actinomyces wuliandei]|uniref:hypothetical protein n=1 Tax=Actinomyces wuliandei TaxID=2057743 RepID=UPI001117B762|nr:hypothetical protein [Actinomyces wuliandei]